MIRQLFPFVLVLLLPNSAFPYDWLPHGPQGVKITNICFVNSATGVLCTETGIYLYQDDMEWHFYESGLPVIDVAYYTPNKLLLIMGDGSYSDGIYTFDLQTSDFEVVEWFYKPSFLRYYELTGVYFLGQQEGGLSLLIDGGTWYNIGLFDEKPCLDIAFYETQVAVALGDDNDRLLLSSDAGNSWTTPVNAGEFFELEYNGDGDLFAIAPYMASSSGIYKSEDFGNYWEPLIWEWHMTTLACDPFGYVLVGWDDGLGVARVDPNIYDPQFVFINEGLPNTNIHKIKINPVMSAPNIFVCTDSGVFVSHDYLTDVVEVPERTPFEIFPNPIHSGQIATFLCAAEAIGKPIVVFDATGNQVREMVCSGPEENITTHGMQRGIYYIRIQGRDHGRAVKLLVL